MSCFKTMGISLSARQPVQDEQVGAREAPAAASGLLVSAAAEAGGCGAGGTVRQGRQVCPPINVPQQLKWRGSRGSWGGGGGFSFFFSLFFLLFFTDSCSLSPSTTEARLSRAPQKSTSRNYNSVQQNPVFIFTLSFWCVQHVARVFRVYLS